MKKRREQKLERLYDQYRKALGRPDLSADEIEKVREQIHYFAQLICENVWKQKFR
jgi:hypothetical protein